MKRMMIENKLGTNRYYANEHENHITIDKAYPDKTEKMKLVKACPAGLYKLDDQDNLQLDYLGCLECGTCRVLSGGKIVKDWNHPIGGYGVEFCQG